MKPLPSSFRGRATGTQLCLAIRTSRIASQRTTLRIPSASSFWPDWLMRASIEFRRIVVVRKGRGFGRSIVRAVKELCFNELQAHRLWLDVKAHNDRARSLYKSENFSEEGLLRECIRGPLGFESLVVMALLHHELE